MKESPTYTFTHRTCTCQLGALVLGTKVSSQRLLSVGTLLVTAWVTSASYPFPVTVVQAHYRTALV